LKNIYGKLKKKLDMTMVEKDFLKKYGNGKIVMEDKFLNNSKN
jgi:hypothetical protein